MTSHLSVINDVCVVRDVKVSRPALSQDHFFGLTVIGLGLMR